ELEEYTGSRSGEWRVASGEWDEFFRNWVYGPGMTDWSVERVRIEPLQDPLSQPRYVPSFLFALPAGRAAGRHGYRATVLLHQKAEYNEPTVLGISLDGSDLYQIRIPIHPQAQLLEMDDPPARVESLTGNRVRVEVELPCKPTQITVDPDQVLVDR